MGIVLSIINESFPPKSKFNVEDIPDLSGKVIIVTGANTGQYAPSFFHCSSASNYRCFNQGIGKETARVSPRASYHTSVISELILASNRHFSHITLRST